MNTYDMIFLHPPKYLLESSRVLRPPRNFLQFSVLPVGVFSLASNLQKEGYETKIINLGIDIATAEEQVTNTESKIYGIDLHWFVHAHGAIEVARMCRKYHPNSLIVLGGFTATWFAEEILDKYPIIDCIIQGEAERSLTKLVKNYMSGKDLDDIKGIAYRKDGKVKMNPMSIQNCD